jgi:hypothetical protein
MNAEEYFTAAINLSVDTYREKWKERGRCYGLSRFGIEKVSTNTGREAITC